MCGADWRNLLHDGMLPGSSPRVRSGRPRFRHDGRRGGIISACAERTAMAGGKMMPRGDHLRVCGADDRAQQSGKEGQGSSPRVRSGPRKVERQVEPGGIISACAERTAATWCAGSGIRDHLRVCGADHGVQWREDFEEGSSPRVRSGHRQLRAADRPAGIISACAERTKYA